MKVRSSARMVAVRSMFAIKEDGCRWGPLRVERCAKMGRLLRADADATALLMVFRVHDIGYIYTLGKLLTLTLFLSAMNASESR